MAAPPLTYGQKERILRDVILGVPPPASESPEARAFRSECRRDVDRAKQHGLMPEIPFDPTALED